MLQLNPWAMMGQNDNLHPKPCPNSQMDVRVAKCFFSSSKSASQSSMKTAGYLSCKDPKMLGKQNPHIKSKQ